MRVRLPIFGENERDRRMRALFTDVGLGALLGKHDGDTEPSQATFDEVWRRYFGALNRKCAMHGFLYQEADCDECEFVVETIAELEWTAKTATAWLAKQMGEDFSRDDDSLADFSWHDCRNRVLALRRPRYIEHTGLVEKTPPNAGGVYYVLVFDRIKIGKSKNISARIRDIATATPCPPRLVAYEIGDPDVLEAKAHERWKAYRRHREWFVCEGEFAAWLLQTNKAGA